ncbi:MAG: dodecin family protein [Xanthobacteraceae bacterium]|nr:dodecin family protein [Xanthobacteraceae bacterium]
MAAKREAKVRPLRVRAGATTGRGGAVAFAAEAALVNRDEAVNPDDHVYRVIEIVGTSEEGVDDAISGAIARASQTLRHLRWFEVIRTSGHIVDGGVKHYQVTLKVGFTMEGPH